MLDTAPPSRRRRPPWGRGTGWSAGAPPLGEPGAAAHV